MVDYIHPKVYFVSESKTLQKQVFNDDWYNAMKNQSGEKLTDGEPPAFSVSIERF
jgi:hypothetical protein